MQTRPQSIERIPPGRNGWPSRRNMIAWLGRLGIDFHHLKALGWNTSIPRSRICQCRRYLMEKDLCQECQDLKIEYIVSNNNLFSLLERHVLKQTLHEWCTDFTQRLEEYIYISTMDESPPWEWLMELRWPGPPGGKGKVGKLGRPKKVVGNGYCGNVHVLKILKTTFVAVRRNEDGLHLVCTRCSYWS